MRDVISQECSTLTRGEVQGVEVIINDSGRWKKGES